MPTKETAVEKFHRVLSELEEKTGCRYEICYPDLDKAIEDNRLSSNWFEPYTVLAKAKTVSSTVTFEVVGDFAANLRDPSGVVVQEFSGCLVPYERGGVSILNDNDIASLTDGSYPTGHRLDVIRDNSVCMYVDNKMIDPPVSEFASVAKSILRTGDVVTRLIAEAETADDINPGFTVNDEDRLKDKAINDRLDKIFSGNTVPINSDADIFEIPDRAYIDPELKDDRPPLPDDIPRADDTDIGKPETDDNEDIDANKGKSSEIESGTDSIKEPAPSTKEETAAEKTPKKQTKKTSGKKTGRPAKKAAKANTDNAPMRFDLLPLGMISDFISAFDKATEDSDVFMLVEQYKSDKTDLLNVAASYAKANYVDAPEAVMAIAKIFEKDAEMNGENEWKKGESLTFINAAIKEQLLSMRSDENEERTATILANFFCAAYLNLK